MKIHTIKEAEEFLMNRLPVFQNEGKKAYKPGLDRIQNLLFKIGNPENKVPAIHVAGTNGKGTTSNALAAILQNAGYKVGLFTSPHFIDFTERIKINGKNAEPNFVCDFLNTIDWQVETTSYFELLTAMGFAYFNKEKVDVAIIEVGLGGRLDSTNICHSILSLITNLGLDHCDMLGDTLELIATEKAGIKKEGIPMLVAPIEDSCKLAIIEKYGENEIQFLAGNPNENNNRLLVREAVSSLSIRFPKLFNVSLENSWDSMQSTTGFQGRFQKLEYKGVSFLLDVAHNAPALRQLFDRVSQEFGSNVVYMMGFSSDKDIRPVSSFFPSDVTYLPVQASVLRAKKIQEVKNILEQENRIVISNPKGCKVSESIEYVVDMKFKELVVITGSFFVVADALKYFQEN